MTRTQAIDLIKAKLNQLPDERVATFAELASAWTEPTVYSTLSDVEKAEIDTALDEFDTQDELQIVRVWHPSQDRLRT